MQKPSLTISVPTDVPALGSVRSSTATAMIIIQICFHWSLTTYYVTDDFIHNGRQDIAQHYCIPSINSLKLSDAYKRSASSHNLNQCWLSVIWTLRNKFLWNLNMNSIIVIQENAFEKVACQNGAYFVQGGWVKDTCAIQLKLSKQCFLKQRSFSSLLSVASPGTCTYKCNMILHEALKA